MKNNWTWVLIVVLVVILAIAGYLIFSNSMTNTPTGGVSNGNTGGNTGGNTSSGGNSNNQTTPETYHIAIKSFAFSPSTLTISKGDKVTWTNMDSATHTVTSDSGSELASGDLSNGQSFSHTFSTVGTFNYHCSIHTSMKGIIIVE